MPKLTKMNLVWLAAMIDGEGTVMLVRHARGSAAESRQPSLANIPSYRPRVGIYNTDHRLMDAIVERSGIDRIYAHQLPVAMNHKKVAYEWRANTAELWWFLPQIRPYLVLKGEQVDLVLQAMAISRSRLPVKGEKWAHIRQSDTDRLKSRSALISIANKVTELNRKGRRK